MSNKDKVQSMEDDGSLSFLGIGRDPESRSFNCETTSQNKLVNTTFWVKDFIENVETRYSRQKGTRGQTLVQIMSDRNAVESETKKFFTGSQEILYVLKKIREMNAFPRRVTLRQQGNRYFLE